MSKHFEKIIEAIAHARRFTYLTNPKIDEIGFYAYAVEMPNVFGTGTTEFDSCEDAINAVAQTLLQYSQLDVGIPAPQADLHSTQGAESDLLNGTGLDGSEEAGATIAPAPRPIAKRENRSEALSVKMTPDLKKQLREYALTRSITMSSAVCLLVKERCIPPYRPVDG